MEKSVVINKLKELILKKVGFGQVTPEDCKKIAVVISKYIGKYVSENTIKRLFGFSVERHTLSRSTLIKLQEYVDLVNNSGTNGLLSKRTVRGRIIYKDNFLANLPKQLQLLDVNLKILYTRWLDGWAFEINDLDPNVYVLKLILPTGEEQSMVVDLTHDELELIVFGANTNSSLPASRLIDPRKEEFKHLFFGDKNGDVVTDYIMSEYHVPPKFDTLELILVRLVGDKQWYAERLTKLKYEEIFKNRASYNFRTGVGPEMLVISSNAFDSKVICCPPNTELRLELKLSLKDPQNSHLLDAQIYSNEWDAEALLGMLSNGAIRDAKSFLKSSEQAEVMLLRKMSNPSAAAIGGYFLLKTREFERMHDWANNLAIRFPQMPDGAIIYAWFMISEQEKGSDNFQWIRQQLLEAQQRGIPLYTEGIRLLFEGLMQLSTLGKSMDVEVEGALNFVRSYMDHIDWDCKNTTFNSIPKQMHGMVAALNNIL